MAIFKGEDATLPMLTQVYQIDPAKPEEIEHLTKKMLSGFDHQRYEDALAELSEDDRAQKQEWLAAVCQLTRNVMTTLYERGGITKWENMSLDFHMRQFPSGFLTPDPDELTEKWRDEKGTLHYIIPLSMIKESSSAHTEDLPRQIIMLQLRALIREMKTGEARLGKCEHCQSIHIIKRADQRYCSNRCSSRARMRRHRDSKKVTPYSPKKEEKPVTVG